MRLDRWYEGKGTKSRHSEILIHGTLIYRCLSSECRTKFDAGSGPRNTVVESRSKCMVDIRSRTLPKLQFMHNTFFGA